MHTWKTRIAATLAVLMLTNCISPAAFAQNTEESPQSTQVSLLSDENNADFTIEDGVLTAYTGSDTSVTIPEGVTVIGDGSSPISEAMWNPSRSPLPSLQSRTRPSIIAPG